jgi:hypothetical protein
VVHATSAPDGLVGVLMVVNTVLVVMLQVPLARCTETWAGARRSIRGAALAFSLSALLIAAAGAASAALAVVALTAAAVVAAIAEMLDSAAWWTISYEYPPRSALPDYLAAFDVVTPAVNICGPPLMIGIVGLGTLGWTVYAAAFVVVAAAAAPALRDRIGEAAATPPSLIP